MSAPAEMYEPIVHRVTRAYHLEPLRILGEGIAGVDEIDQIMRTLGGFRAGPFERMDTVGLDVDQEISRQLWRELGEPARLRPHPLQADLVERGHLGRGSSHGFYLYQGEVMLPAVPVDRRSFDLPPGVYKAVRLFADAATDQGGSFTEQYVFARTLVALINEAALLADGGMAAEETIDSAVQHSTGQPRGPLESAEQIGRHTCATLLRRLEEQAADGRFRPAEWLSR